MNTTTTNKPDVSHLLQLYIDTKRDEYLPVFVFYAVIIFFGIAGNSLAFMFYRFKARKTVSSFFLAMLAANDLIASISKLDKVYQLYVVGYFTNSIGCKLLIFVNHVLVLNSGLFIIAMNIDRCQHVCAPFSKWGFTRRSAKVCLVTLVIWSIAVAAPNFFVTGSMTYDIGSMDNNVTITGHRCAHSKLDKYQLIITIFHMIDLLTVVMTIVSAVVIYSLIAWKISKSKHVLKAIEEKAASTEAVCEHANSKHVDSSTILSKDANVSIPRDNLSNGTKGHYDNSAYITDTETNDKNNYQIDRRNGSSESNGTVGAQAHVQSGKVFPNDKHSSSQSKNRLNDNDIIEGGHTSCKNGHAGKTVKNDTINKNSNVIQSNDDSVLKGDHRNKKRRHTHGVSTPADHGANKQKHHTSEIRITAMMFTMTLGTVFCVVPYFYVSLIGHEGMSEDEFEMTAKARLFRGSFAVYSTLNPYVIGIFYTEFRVFVIGLLKRLVCCCCLRR